MKLFNLSILTILSFTSSTVHAACSTSNAKGNPNDALLKLGFMCAGLIGNVPKNGITSTCVDVDSISYDVYAVNLKPIDTGLDQNTCTQNLKIPLACERGGITAISDWRFVAVPKPGKCIP
ncbi:hypothetical protein DSL72_002299 [Monilinia vaccinii-corymbosi]|uniref:Secreted protein n=1 Tax=Monilinia vaccinii-corymbosi TaxID=61207 RepID=A0A8A3PC86_9HELO|nr:hypothetical protein DSL72_002299 [Monilinia vaccinii-corymbosi]